MSVINSKIKPFKTQAFKQGKFIEVSEQDVLGSWAVFFFYPADFTFVCPTELGDVADHYEELRRMDVEVYSVSTDTHFVHKAWHDASDTIGKIQYTMLGDPSGAVTNNFGVMREGQGLADRATFIVDPEGTIQHVSVNGLDVGRNPNETLRLLDAFQTGELCPCNWKKGEEVLRPAA